MNFIEISPEYLLPIKRPYPAHQTGLLIEQYAYNYFKEAQDIGDWKYIPIAWTGWFCNCDYGKKTSQLREYLKGLNLPKGRYFTVVQNDDGTLCDDILKEIGCTIFASGGVGDIPLPLLCDSHPYQQSSTERFTYLASFIGSEGTHKLRREMVLALKDKQGYHIGRGNSDHFCKIMCDSKFSLCPRGYGKASYRMYEAIQMGVVPVYISDTFWLPYEIDYNSFCILIKQGQDIDKILKGISDDRYIEMKANLERVKYMFTMEHCCQYVSEKLKCL